MPWPSQSATLANASSEALSPRRAASVTSSPSIVPPASAEEDLGPFGVRAGGVPGVGDQRVAAGVLLPAAPPAAPAQAPVRHHLHVAQLGAHAPPSPVERPSKTMPPPMPVPTVRQMTWDSPAPGAEPGLGPGHGVGVVLHHDGQPDQPADLLLQRLLAPGEVGGETHDGAGLVDEPGRADADGLDLPALRELAYDVGDRVGDHVRPIGGGRPERMGDDRAVVVDHTRGHLRAADVHTDREHCRCSPLSQVYVFHIVAAVVVPRSTGGGRLVQRVQSLPERGEQLAARGHDVPGDVACRPADPGARPRRGRLTLGGDGPAEGARAADVLVLSARRPPRPTRPSPPRLRRRPPGEGA